MVENIDTKLKHVCGVLGVSRPELCKRAGVNYKTLAQAVSRNSKIPAETLDEICEAWQIPREYFSKYVPIIRVTPDAPENPLSRAAARVEDWAAQKAHMDLLRSNTRVNTMDFINWLRRGGGESVDFGMLKGSVDLFFPMTVTDRIPKPYRIGPRSLSTEYFELDDEDHYVRRVMNFDPALLEDVKGAHLRASCRPYDVSDVEISVNVNGKLVSEHYRRTIGKVPSRHGPLVTAVFAELIEPPEPTPAGLADLRPSDT
jgi:transcriptional regulator with XRE-family HTH domain